MAMTAGMRTARYAIRRAIFGGGYVLPGGVVEIRITVF